VANPIRVGHVALRVGNLAEAAQFYTDVLGFQISLQRGQAIFLTCGHVHHDLVLVQASKATPPMDKNGPGLAHLALQVANIDELKAAHAELKESGVTIKLIVDHGVTSSFYFSDPDGNNVEFFCNNQESSAEGLAVMLDPNTSINEPLVLD